MTTIRKSTIADADAIARVQVESWKTTYAGIVPDAFLAALDIVTQTQMWTEQINADSSLVFVVEDKTGVTGFVCGGCLREPVENYDAELYAIYLLQPKQGRGTGRALTRTLVEALQAGGFKSLLVWVLEQNPSAAFYRHLGGVQVTGKLIDIGEASLPEIAFGWPQLELLLERRQGTPSDK